MTRGWSLGLASVVALFALATAARADEKPALKPGNYIVYYAFSPVASEQAVCLLKVEEKEGKLIATVEDAPMARAATLKKFSADGKKVDIALEVASRPMTFEGAVSSNDARAALGNYGDGKVIYRARLAATENAKLERTDLVVAPKLPEAMTKLAQLNQKVAVARNKLRQATDATAKADAQKEVEAATKEVNDATPGAYLEVLTKHGDSAPVIDAALYLLRDIAKTEKAEPARWAKLAETFAQPYGPRYHADVLVKLAGAIGTQKGQEALGLELAEKAAKHLTEATPAEMQVRVLKTLLAAELNGGKAAAAKKTEERVSKIEEKLDKDYLAKVPPFKPTPFEGRKGKTDRVAVMELFTGAECPPCVAADVAFDALTQSYKPTDLILLQYHKHIPGPDPLTNDDTDARWKYYGKLTGTPSTLFNGKQAGGGGGGMANAEAKYKQYRGFIDPILEEEAAVKVTAKVARSGDKLSITATAEAQKNSLDNLRVRFVLVEENVRYTGSNGLRFHHQVVRALPGGADGMELKGKSDTKTAEIGLADLRKNLTTYLDNYAKKVMPFRYPDRPMALTHLRVVALVQDDKTKEILQAVQIDVPEAK